MHRYPTYRPAGKNEQVTEEKYPGGEIKGGSLKDREEESGGGGGVEEGGFVTNPLIILQKGIATISPRIRTSSVGKITIVNRERVPGGPRRKI